MRRPQSMKSLWEFLRPQHVGPVNLTLIWSRQKGTCITLPISRHRKNTQYQINHSYRMFWLMITFGVFSAQGLLYTRPLRSKTPGRIAEVGRLWNNVKNRSYMFYFGHCAGYGRCIIGTQMAGNRPTPHDSVMLDYAILSVNGSQWKRQKSMRYLGEILTAFSY